MLRVKNHCPTWHPARQERRARKQMYTIAHKGKMTKASAQSISRTRANGTRIPLSFGAEKRPRPKVEHLAKQTCDLAQADLLGQRPVDSGPRAEETSLAMVGQATEENLNH